MKVVTVGTSSITKTCINSMRKAGIEVYACVGRDLERTHKFAEEMDVDLFSNEYDKVIRSNQFDTVYIATPNSTHFEYAKKALEAHKNVILEKPICSNFKEASSLVKIALANHCYLFENNKVPHSLAFKQMKEDVKNIGDIKVVNLNFSRVSSRWLDFKNGRPQNTFSLEMCGGALMDINMYNISAVVGLFGLPSESLYLCNKVDGIDTSGIALLRYKDFMATCIACKDATSKSYVSIAGERAEIHADKHVSQIENYDIIEGEDVTNKDFYTGDVFLQTFKDYVSIIENNRKDLYEYYLKQSLMTMKVLDDLRKSANIKYPVD